MDDQVKRAIYSNLWLLSQADGKIETEEAAYLRKVTVALGITAAEEAAFRAAARTKDAAFLPVPSSVDVEAAFTIIARMVRVDDEFSPSEQEAYLALGKALGFAPDDLGPILRKVWNADPDELLRLFEHPSNAPSASVLIVEDELGDADAVRRAAPQENLTFCKMADSSCTQCSPSIVIFHVSEEKEISKQRLTAVRKKFPDSSVGFVARRDQAPQIGVLLGLGADRCFVEPLYPNEISKAVREMLRR